MRTCPRCGRTLEVSEFNWKNRAKGWLQSQCKLCSRAYIRDHYSRNTPYYIAKAKVRNRDERRRLIEKVLAYLSTHPCVGCGETDSVVLDFDHNCPDEKSAEIGVMLRKRLSWRRIQGEIAKCSVRCANCHRRRTAQQFGWYRLEAAALAPVAQLDRAPAFEAGGLQVRSLSGAPECSVDHRGAWWRSAYEFLNSATS